MPENKKKQLENILKAFNDGLNRKDFEDNFKKVLDLVQQVIEQNKKNRSDLERRIEQAEKQLKTTGDGKVEETIKELKAQSDKLFKEQQNALDFIRDKVRNIKNGKDGRDGKDADENSVTDKVLSRIQFPEVLAEEVRDKLETLEGDERLDVSAIKGLDDIFDRIESIGKTVHVGGGSVGGGGHVKAYDLSDDLNGSKKTFKLPAFWRVVSVHSSSTPYTFRPTTDYTTDNSDMSITFTSEINASTTLASGQTITIVYAEP